MRSPVTTAAALALLIGGLGAIHAQPASAALEPALKPSQSSFFAVRGAEVRDTLVHRGRKTARRARVAASNFGGPITVTVGGKQETVTVYTSNAFTRDITVNRSWADFFASLPHGPELATMTVLIESIEQISADCGPSADSCYDPDSGTMYLVGVTPLDGADIKQIAAHEYGHHVAANRLNPPWDPITWGPKYWASVQRVCSHATGLARKMYPGDEGLHYEDNPAEVWAETYRVIASRRSGLEDEGWLIVNSAWNPKLPGRPTDLLLGAGTRDVENPWKTARSASISGSFARSGTQSRSVRVSLSLDGTISATATTTGTLRVQVKLIRSSGATLASGSVSSASRTSAKVCSQPFVTARIARVTGTGNWTLTTSDPGA